MPHDAARPAARQHLRRALRRVPGRREGAVPLPERPRGQGGARRPGRGLGRPGHRHPPHPGQGGAVQGPRPGRHRRGAALRRRAQGAAQGAAHLGRRAGDVGHPDPAHARDGGHRHPRDVDPADPARGAPPGAHLRRCLRREDAHRLDPARADARGPGLLRAQQGVDDREGRGPHPRARARGPHRGGPREDGRAQARAGRARLLGEAVRRARLHDDRRDRPRHLQRQHADRRAGRPARPLPAAPAARARRPWPRAGLLLLPVPARGAAHRDGARPAADHRQPHRPRLRACRWR